MKERNVFNVFFSKISGKNIYAHAGVTCTFRGFGVVILLFAGSLAAWVPSARPSAEEGFIGARECLNILRVSCKVRLSCVSAIPRDQNCPQIGEGRFNFW